MNRNLDGCYFRVKRDGKYEPICFSDLTEEEREEIATMNGGRSAEWWKNLCYHLADRLKNLGDQLDIVCAD